MRSKAFFVTITRPMLTTVQGLPTHATDLCHEALRRFPSRQLGPAQVVQGRQIDLSVSLFKLATPRWVPKLCRNVKEARP